MIWTEKQSELLKNLDHRYTLCCGATRSGKTYMQYFIIPKKIRELKDKDGLIVIMGNTRGTVQRNIIEPLKSMWSDTLVSSINSQNKATLFGQEAYVLGADKVTSVDKLRGSSIKLCIGDELTTWNSEVFEMLKSRLDKSYSQFFGTANPAHSKHYLKADFIDVASERNIDLFYQHYCLDDNPFCAVAEEIKKEYVGVFYERYVLGKWCNAEGVIYPQMANNSQGYIIEQESLPKNLNVYVGVDFGKNKSDTAFVATGILNKKLYVLYAKSVPMSGKTFEQLEQDFSDFVAEYQSLYDYPIKQVYCDSAEPTYINTFRSKFKDLIIRGSVKNTILERIRATSIMLSTNSIFFVKGRADVLVEALSEAVWDESKGEDVRLDDGTSNIDILDAFEYSWEYYLHNLVRIKHNE